MIKSVASLFQHGLCDWTHWNGEDGFSFKRVNGQPSENNKPSFDHFGDPYGKLQLGNIHLNDVRRFLSFFDPPFRTLDRSLSKLCG